MQHNWYFITFFKRLRKRAVASTIKPRDGASIALKEKGKLAQP
jgi:hypothetical protein